MSKHMETFTKDNSLMASKHNQITMFENSEFGQLRTLTINGEPYFVGKDVAIALGYSDTKQAIRNNVDEEDKIHLSKQQFGGCESTTSDINNNGAIVINESGLYSLVFGSRLESAKRFKHWVTSEILPSIRKHGAYATESTIDQILNNPDYGIALLTKLKEERAAREEAQRKNAILMHVNKTYTATEIAKELGLKSAAQLNKILEEKKIQYKVNDTWVLRSDYSNLGYEEIKQEVLDSGKVIYHRKFTQMGRDFILNILGA